MAQPTPFIAQPAFGGVSPSFAPAQTRDRDYWGRPTYTGVRPIAVCGGFQLGTVTETRTEDGWESEYDITDWTIYPTEEAALAAARGEVAAADREAA